MCLCISLLRACFLSCCCFPRTALCVSANSAVGPVTWNGMGAGIGVCWLNVGLSVLGCVWGTGFVFVLWFGVAGTVYIMMMLHL